jgi:signal transduction histidine kinase
MMFTDSEKMKRYARGLRQTNQEIRDLARVISHHLRTPLANIRGFSGEIEHALRELRRIINDHMLNIDENAKTVLGAILDRDIPESLGFINSSVGKVDKLINSVLNLSAVVYRELRFEKVELESLVQSVLKTLSHQIDESGVRIKVGTLPVIVSDRAAMEQIFRNILDNAVKYVAAGRPGEIEITSEPNNDEVTISHVHDNGRGIAADDLMNVFEPFRRVGKLDIPGDGMGLTCARTLIRRLGGRIWCQSEESAGTTFSFYVGADPEMVQ